MFGGGVGRNQPAMMDDFMFDTNGGEGFFFSDSVFHSLPEFACLSPPSSASTFPARTNSTQSSCSSTSSSLNSSLSSRSLFQVPDCGGDLQQLPAEVPSMANEMTRVLAPPPLFIRGQRQSREFSDDLSLFNGLADLSSSLFDAAHGAGAVAIREAHEGQRFPGHGEGDVQQGWGEEEDGDDSDAVSRVFNEWMSYNGGSISPEVFSSVEMQSSAVEDGSIRFGGGKRGMRQRVNPVFDCVPKNHSQRKRLRPSLAVDHQSQPFPINSAIAGSTLAPGYSSGTSYSMAAMAHGGGSGEMGYPGTPAPYLYGHQNQRFSPLPEFAEPNLEVWRAGQPSASVPQFEARSSPATSSNHQDHGEGEGEGEAPGSGGAGWRTKEARKRRIARQKQRVAFLRRLSHGEHPLQLQAAAIESSHSAARNCASWTNTVSGPYQMSYRNHHMAAPPSSISTRMVAAGLPLGAQPQTMTMMKSQHGAAAAASSLVMKRQGWKNENLRFLLKKVLRQSDVGSLGRIVLPKKESESHLPELTSRDGISIPMEDIDTSQVWNMRYRYWPNNKSRMYLLENTGDFVRSNGLREGDCIMIYIDLMCGKYLIQGAKGPQPAIA